MRPVDPDGISQEFKVVGIGILFPVALPQQQFPFLADPGRQGLLYAGTESGMYVSFDDGSQWQAFQMNLPVVPITDLAVKNDDLVVATQGRSFWILDDLTLLHQLDEEKLKQDVSLFTPRTTYRL